MMTGRILGVASVLASLAVATAAAAQNRPAQPPASKARPIIGGLQPTKRDTNCFEMMLPMPFGQYLRQIFDRPWLGRWGYSWGQTKVIVTCKRYMRGPFANVLRASMAYFNKLLTGWRQTGQQFIKDGGRNLVKITGQGFVMVTDPRTRRVSRVPHTAVRLFRRYPKTNLMVSITFLAPTTMAASLNGLVQLVARTFDPIDLAEKAKLKARTPQRPPQRPRVPAGPVRK